MSPPTWQGPVCERRCRRGRAFGAPSSDAGVHRARYAKCQASTEPSASHRIAAVADANTVYVRLSGSPGQLLITRDGGQHFDTLLDFQVCEVRWLRAFSGWKARAGQWARSTALGARPRRAPKLSNNSCVRPAPRRELERSGSVCLRGMSSKQALRLESPQTTASASRLACICRACVDRSLARAAAPWVPCVPTLGRRSPNS